MKLRNVRRRQWDRYFRQLAALALRGNPHAWVNIRTRTLGRDVAIPYGYEWMQEWDHRRRESNWRRRYAFVHHAPQWEPADLPVDAEGNTRPGFECTHQLENGNGPCGGNVFRIEEAIGDHGCIVERRNRR